jgi:hypothetical protein
VYTADLHLNVMHLDLRAFLGLVQENDINYRKIWDFGRNWDPDAYAAQPRSLSEIRRDLVMQRNWKASLDRIKATMAVGCLQVLLLLSPRPSGTDVMCGPASCLWHRLCCCYYWLRLLINRLLLVLLLSLNAD